MESRRNGPQLASRHDDDDDALTLTQFSGLKYSTSDLAKVE